MSKFYGQPWISDNQLLQEVVTFKPGADAETTVEVLIDNIWENLLDNVVGKVEPPVGTEQVAGPSDPTVSGYYQSVSNPKFFFWKVKQTPIDEASSDFYLAFPCPEPDDKVFANPDPEKPTEYDPSKYDENTQPWPFYWVTKMKQAEENYENEIAIQRKEITFPGSSFVGQDGEPVTLDEMTIKNNDLSDISNLLRLF